MSYHTLWEQDKNHVIHPWMDFPVFKKFGLKYTLTGSIDDMETSRFIVPYFNKQVKTNIVVKKIIEKSFRFLGQKDWAETR